MKDVEISRRLGLTTGLALLASGCAQAPGWIGGTRPGQLRNDLAERLTTEILEAQARGFNGSVFVSEKGVRIIDAAFGFADAEHLRPVRRGTLFHVASVTKLITAVAVMQLVQEGRLHLEDRLDRYFPGVPADKAAITVTQLLTHGSGLGQDYAADGIEGRDDAVRAILATKLRFQPGERFGYTNEGPELLAAIIEAVCGETYEQRVRRRVFRPAGMATTRFWDEVDDRTTPSAAAIISRPDDLVGGRNWGQIGSGGVWSNADDLARLAAALTHGRLLAPPALKELLTPRIDARGDWAIFGAFERMTPPQLFWMRGSEDFGHNAVVFWYPHRDVVMTLASNSGQDGDYASTRLLANRLEKIVFPESRSAP